jgi:hypothetical protein
MALYPPTKESRDANLDNLSAAVEQWYQTEKVRIESEVRFLKQVKQGRGASSLARLNLETASQLLQSEVNDFLQGV